MQEHTLSSFDQQLKGLDAELLAMAALARVAVENAFAALGSGDLEKARGVIASDRALDEKQQAIEQKAVLAIARNQPMAIDLRELVAAMRISGDLERIGDLAKNIAKRTIAIGDAGLRPEHMAGIAQLARLVASQLDEVLDAYAERDDERAIALRDRDEDIDALHTSVFRDLLTYMLEDARNITICAHLLFCAKNIERIGDHATNIAETVYYIRTGEILEDDRPKADRSSEG